mgnify:CR=1 FL=1
MVENIKEIIGAILCVVGMAALIFLYLVATPDQMSAECDYWKYEGEKAGVAR